MVNFDELSGNVEDNIVSTDNKDFAPEIYKKWFKTSSFGGFLSISPWLDGGKWTIDIGAVDSSSKPTSNTKCFVDAVAFNTYLTEVVAGRGYGVYPKRAGLASPESFISYGGSEVKGRLISRVFKAHWWGASADNEGDQSAFVFKCGHFEGKRTDSGAITPDLSSALSTDMIKVTRVEFTEIAYRLDVQLRAYAARNPEWYDSGR